MSLSEKRTQLKNRIHSALEKYGLICGQTELSDLFGKAGRQWMEGQTEVSEVTSQPRMWTDAKDDSMALW
jgi:hypothetical protein